MKLIFSKVWFLGGHIAMETPDVKHTVPINYEDRMSKLTYFLDLNTLMFEKRGPNMPEPRMRHCTLAINSSHYFIHGGQSCGNPTTYIYDMTRDVWHKQENEELCGEQSPIAVTKCIKNYQTILVPTYEHVKKSSCTAIFNILSGRWSKLIRDSRRPLINAELTRYYKLL